MSLFNDTDWTKSGHSLDRIANYKEVTDYAKRFLRGHRSFFGLENEENGMERTLTNQKKMRQ